MEEVYDVEPIEESTSKVLATLSDYVPEIRRTPEQVKAAIESVEALVREHMREKIDFGTIPGTPKPSLYKAGAERINRFFGMGAVVQEASAHEDWDGGFLSYTYRVGVGPITMTGVVPIAWCEGSANSKEKKYQNKSVYDLANTLRKMAQKRAYVGATLMATNTSDFFSQDLEDLPREMLREDRPAKSDNPADTIMTFGKYQGMSLGAIQAENPGYLSNYLRVELDKKAAAGKISDEQMDLYDAVKALT